VQKRLVTIHNKAGIHCRPSTVILNTISKEFPGHRFAVIHDGITTELNSILAIISLGLSCGTQAAVQVEGPEEEKAIKRIGDLFEYEFDFPEK
jgi:phosphocarrier protein